MTSAKAIAPKFGDQCSKPAAGMAASDDARDPLAPGVTGAHIGLSCENLSACAFASVDDRDKPTTSAFTWTVAVSSEHR